MRTFYKAFNGMDFDDMNECIKYEKEKTLKVMESIKVIKNFCEQFEDCDGNCPLYDEDRMCCQIHGNPIKW